MKAIPGYPNYSATEEGVIIRNVCDIYKGRSWPMVAAMVARMEAGILPKELDDIGYFLNREASK